LNRQKEQQHYTEMWYCFMSGHHTS